LIQFENVSFSYDGRVRVIDGAEGTLGPGLTLCLGLNGCGKSTLLKLAAGVEYPDSGRILVGDRDLWTDEVAARRNLAYFPEHPDLTPYATINDILRLVCRLRGEEPGRAAEALEAVGLGGLAGRSVRELSLGQRRRALFASILIGRPDQVLLDEPLEAMDNRISDEILSWIRMRVKSGATVVVVSHALDPFVELAARAVTIEQGKVRIVEVLPSVLADRLSLLQSLAKGLPLQARAT
jgi:ABC-type multidrug transport system ATPase subunit